MEAAGVQAVCQELEAKPVQAARKGKQVGGADLPGGRDLPAAVVHRVPLVLLVHVEAQGASQFGLRTLWSTRPPTDMWSWDVQSHEWGSLRSCTTRCDFRAAEPASASFVAAAFTHSPSPRQPCNARANRSGESARFHGTEWISPNYSEEGGGEMG